MKSIPTAYAFMDGWAFHYNFIRGHESLDGKTPAEKAELTSPFKDWLDVARQQEIPKDVTVDRYQQGERQLIVPLARRHKSRKLYVRRETAPSLSRTRASL